MGLPLSAPGFADAVEWLELPAGVAGGSPWLRRDGDGLSLSWVTQRDGVYALRASRYDGANWRPAATVASGDGWFNSSADFARVLPLGDGALLAAWLEFTSFRDFHYRFAAALSLDRGASWQPVGSPPAIAEHGYHGFVSAFADDGGFVLFWISGFRDHAGLWRARLGRDGRWSAAERIDERVCNCCLTAVSRAGTLVYRDREPGEVRDIALLVHAATATRSRPLHADNWRIAACPKNGPAIAEHEQRRAVAWFTDADDGAETRLLVTPGTADGPVSAAGGRSRGQVDVAWLGGPRLALSTLTRDSGIEIYLIDAAGVAPRVERRIELPGSAGAGQPTLAYLGGALYVAFHDADARAIRVARIDFAG